MASDIQLEDMLESYPPITTPNFQARITAKKEFSELASDIRERLPPGRGKYFKHQRFTHRFLRAHDDLLILSETGTGKSCEVMGFTEYTRRELDKAKVDPFSADEKAAHFKRVYILVKNETQGDELKNQLACKCSDGHYVTELVSRAKTEADQKANITRAVTKAGYVIKTYGTFVSMINKEYPSDEAIVKEFSDTIFWIDEAHNLLVDQEFTNPTEKQRTYNMIWRVFHLIQRSKRIISTATPMINDEKELGSLMNLILPATQQFPPQYDFSTATLENLAPYLQGRVSFIRASDTGAVVKEIQDPNKLVEIGQEITDKNVTYKSQLVVYASRMSNFQSEAYGRARGKGRTEQNVQRGIYQNERQASNFVFPDGMWGNGGKLTNTEPVIMDISRVESALEGGVASFTGEKHAFIKYVEVKGHHYRASPELHAYLTNIDNIRTLSCKFAAICQNIRDKPGNGFVYGEFVEGSGAIVLALCLEGLGFVRYDETETMFVGLNRDDIKPFCATSDIEASNRSVKPTIAKRLRYALLTGNTSTTRRMSMLNAMNSYENRHGEYIKVLIASHTGREAINVNNVLQIHLIGSEWNQSAMYQAISRGIRATSHDDLIRDEVERLRATGMSEVDAKANAKVDVSIYKHAAIADDDQSIDVQMYRLSESKDRAIKRLMRIMKQCAIGCKVHYNRNVRDTDEDYSAACDYDLCHYECVDPLAGNLEEDLSTYDVLYSGELVAEARRNIVNIYRQINSASLGTIQGALPQFRPKYILMALEQLITNKTPILDRFGYTTYLREDSASFYLDRNYPTSAAKAAFAMSYYTNGIIALEKKTLSDMAVELEAEKNEETREELVGIDANSPEFAETLQNMDINGQASVLEDAILQKVQGKNSTYIDTVLKLYEYYIIEMREPITELNKLYEASVITKPKVGRPLDLTKERRPKRINLNALTTLHQDTDSQIVYIHTLYSKIGGQTAYDTMSNIKKGEGRRRILRTEESGIGAATNPWQDIDTIQNAVYNVYIQAELAKKAVSFEEQGIYGFVTDGVFRIIDKVHETEKAKQDIRSVSRGAKCSEISPKEKLFDIMWLTGVPGIPGAPYQEAQAPALRQRILDSALTKYYTVQDINSWDILRLSYYHKLLISTSLYKPALCSIIHEHFEKTGRIQK